MFRHIRRPRVPMDAREQLMAKDPFFHQDDQWFSLDSSGPIEPHERRKSLERQTTSQPSTSPVPTTSSSPMPTPQPRTSVLSNSSSGSQISPQQPSTPTKTSTDAPLSVSPEQKRWLNQQVETKAPWASEILKSEQDQNINHGEQYDRTATPQQQPIPTKIDNPTKVSDSTVSNVSTTRRYEVTVDVEQFRPDEIKVFVDDANHNLIIRGRHHDENNQNCWHFKRRFKVPDAVNPKDLECEWHDDLKILQIFEAPVRPSSSTGSGRHVRFSDDYDHVVDEFKDKFKIPETPPTINNNTMTKSPYDQTQQITVNNNTLTKSPYDQAQQIAMNQVQQPQVIITETTTTEFVESFPMKPHHLASYRTDSPTKDLWCGCI